ncbi:hypothetical protein PHYPSEUDO_015228 [Phytophthora pseudosyringae]|uniref:Uncharacterized protein n=1 Tax=Phytophthora pseudosyringae TaxID=221518 RepID=A0A8T1W3S7_9STRA|nr:hypothetical protein PHYPSEUDO_015228 [Phytophthora pseudosyringae]
MPGILVIAVLLTAVMSTALLVVSVLNAFEYFSLTLFLLLNALPRVHIVFAAATTTSHAEELLNDPDRVQEGPRIPGSRARLKALRAEGLQQ